MIRNDRIAQAGEMNEAASPERRAERLDRRAFLFGAAAGLGALSLGGCVSDGMMSLAEAEKIYGPLPHEKFPVPAADVSKLDPKYYRQIVSYDSKEEPGGSGEVGVSTVAPALCNALAAAGTRPRRLPIRNEGFSWV